MSLFISKKKCISKIPVIALSIVLLTGLILAPPPPFLQSVEAQSQNNNNSGVGISQVINHPAAIESILRQISIQTAILFSTAILVSPVLPANGFS